MNVIPEHTWLMIVYDGSVHRSASLESFECKVRGNVSERSFNRLRALLQKKFHVNIDDIRRTRRHLASELGLYTQEYDCCVQGCMPFTGSGQLLGKCLYWRAAR